MTAAGLAQCVNAMRKNSEYVAGKYMQERPMMMAVDAIDWTNLKRAGADKVSLTVMM